MEEFDVISVLKAPPHILSIQVTVVLGNLPELIAQGIINQSVWQFCPVVDVGCPLIVFPVNENALLLPAWGGLAGINPDVTCTILLKIQTTFYNYFRSFIIE